jgi:hypothetical protein
VRSGPRVLSFVTALLAASTAHAEVQFSLQAGRVVIVARDASVAEILAEWARIGRTAIVNADRLPADRVTLELQSVPEQQALDILLRGTSGYVVMSRPIGDPSASAYDRIAIMPPSVMRPEATTAAAPIRAPQGPAAPVEAMPPIAAEPPPIAPAEATADNSSGSDAEPPTMIGGLLVSPEMAERQATFKSRRMLETVNPRDFQLPAALRGRVAVPPGGPVPTGVATPGTVVVPIKR